jgi:hypothetical protein
MGTMASGITVQDVKRTIRLCSAAGDPGYRPWCFVGAVKNFIDVTANPADGFEFCKSVSARRRQAAVLGGDRGADRHPVLGASTREVACAKAPEGQEECRYGAGLLATAPAGLPILPGRRSGGS